MDYNKYIGKYAEKVEEYIRLGESQLPFKSFGASSGVYQERSGHTYMVRPKTPGGMIDRVILEGIRDIVERYSDGTIRFSTRQDFQIHKLALTDTVKVIEELKQLGLYTIGTGGNTSRNVAGSAMSGLDPADEFDISEYIKIASEYLSKNENNLILPRKFKAAITSSRRDTGSVTFGDIGFVAKMVDGRRGFDVYGGGGLGPAPRIAIPLAKSIDADDILYHIDAMIEFFRAEGDRENRAKARLRHLVKKYGEENFKTRYYEYLEKSRLKNLKISVGQEEIKDREWRSSTRVRSTFLEQTREQGIYSVYIHPQGGKMSNRQLNEVIDFLNSLDHQVEMRLTNTQGLLLRDLGGVEAKKIVGKIRAITDDMELSKSVCCVGAQTCRVGINPSQELLDIILKHFKSLDLRTKRALPKLFISGCPSSCGQHQIGAISFSGKRKNIDGVSREAYTIYLDGKVGYGDGDERYAERYGDVLKEEIPKLLEQIARIKLASEIEDIYEFIEEKRESLTRLIGEYSI